MCHPEPANNVVDLILECGCGNTFLESEGVGNEDRLFCSDTCRDDYHRERAEEQRDLD